MGKFQDLIVYQKAFGLAMDIFHMTAVFPKEERYGLISQIRRSSRSVCSCIAEGYRKRQYESHFVAKLSDADMENSETQVWLEFALACKYIDQEMYSELLQRSEENGKLIGYMIENPKKYA
jgi:four helix bundle protein